MSMWSLVWIRFQRRLLRFFEGNSYEDVVRNAVSLGGDTDTIAAIAGAMADAMYGVPGELVAKGLKYLENDMLEALEGFSKLIKK